MVVARQLAVQLLGEGEMALSELPAPSTYENCSSEALPRPAVGFCAWAIAAAPKTSNVAQALSRCIIFRILEMLGSQCVRALPISGGKLRKRPKLAPR